MQYSILRPLVLYSVCQKFWSQDISWEKEYKKSDEYLRWGPLDFRLF